MCGVFGASTGATLPGVLAALWAGSAGISHGVVRDMGLVAQVRRGGPYLARGHRPRATSTTGSCNPTKSPAHLCVRPGHGCVGHNGPAVELRRRAGSRAPRWDTECLRHRRDVAQERAQPAVLAVVCSEDTLSAFRLMGSALGRRLPRGGLRDAGVIIMSCAEPQRRAAEWRHAPPCASTGSPDSARRGRRRLRRASAASRWRLWRTAPDVVIAVPKGTPAQGYTDDVFRDMA